MYSYQLGHFLPRLGFAAISSVVTSVVTGERRASRPLRYLARRYLAQRYSARALFGAARFGALPVFWHPCSALIRSARLWALFLCSLCEIADIYRFLYFVLFFFFYCLSLSIDDKAIREDHIYWNERDVLRCVVFFKKLSACCCALLHFVCSICLSFWIFFAATTVLNGRFLLCSLV